MTENNGLFHQKYKTKRAKCLSFVQIRIFCRAIYFMRVKAKCSRCHPSRTCSSRTRFDWDAGQFAPHFAICYLLSAIFSKIAFP